MAYNEDYKKLLNLALNSSVNSYFEKLNEFALNGDTNYINNNDIYNMREVLAYWGQVINALIDLANKITEEYNIDNINEQIQQIQKQITEIMDLLSKIDLSKYYTKKEVDNLLEELRKLISNIDLSKYYTKEEIDNKLQEIGAPDLTDFFTKPEVRSILTSVRNLSLSPVYNQIQITENNSHMRMDYAYINFKIRRTDGKRFIKLNPYRVSYLPYLVDKADIAIYGVGKHTVTEKYSVTCAGYVDNLGTLQIAPSFTVDEILVSGIVKLQGYFDAFMLFNPTSKSYITPPTDIEEFTELSVNQIQEKLSIRGETWTEIENTSMRRTYVNTSKTLTIGFYKRIQMGDIDIYDKYDIGFADNSPETIMLAKQILNNTFNMEEVELIMSKRDEENFNWINIPIRDKRVALEQLNTISVSYNRAEA